MAEGIPIGGSDNLGPSGINPNQMPADESPESSDGGFEKMVENMPNTASSSKPSPMNVAQNAQPSMQSGQVSAENLMSNMQQVLDQMQGLKTGLQTPNLKLNPRTRRLLGAKLKRTNDNIRYIHSKVNVGDEDNDQSGNQHEMIPKGSTDDDSSAHIGRFLSFLTDGQSQLESAMHSVSKLKNRKNPGLMLENIFSMQVKLYRAQTEIEFSTAVLQKSY